jgi:hypothetical protein
MATRSGVSRQIRTARSLAVPHPRERGIATARSRARTGRLCTVPDFHPGRAWSDLLFTMSDNTRPLGRTPRGRDLDVLLDEPRHCRMQRRESPARRRASGRISGASRAEFIPVERPPVWWSQTGSNRRPPACKAGALPTELWPRQKSAAGRRAIKNKHSHLIADYRLPISENWWAWEDLNFRPHAYQARALTS